MNNIIFNADFRASLTRYGGFLFGAIYMLIYLILRALTDSRIESFEVLSSIYSNYKVILVFVGILTFGHINLYLAAHNYTRRLILSESSATFYLFNFFKYKVIEFKYSEIENLENNEHPTIFIFTLKSGKKKKIHATVKNRKEALKIIQNKLI